MKPANMLSLADKIVRPDIDKFLVPLMLYKGTRSFGWMHRRWNFAILCMESEVETYGQAVKLSHNPDYAHMCGPRKGIPHSSFPSLFGRLKDHKEVSDLIPGLTNYVRHVVGKNGAFTLTPVDLYTNDPNRKDGRYAPWRIHDYSPEVKAEREKLLQQKRALRTSLLVSRAIEAEFNADMRRQRRFMQRAERAQIRAAATAEQRAWVERKKRERDQLRRQRREARSREQMHRALGREQRLNLFYPYLVHNPANDDDSTRLLLLVNNAVPKHLPSDIRADLCQDLLVALLSGDMDEDELAEGVKAYLPGVRAMHPLKYGNISLDDMTGPNSDDMDRHSLIVPAGYERMEY